MDHATYYLFLIDKPRSGNKLGYMPRKKQAGFIFLEPHTKDEAKLINTIAHELGHGAFRLQHMWEEHASIPKNSTTNLMDYNSGTKLLKFQWDLVHHPEPVIGLFEDDEAGAMVEMAKSKKSKLIVTVSDTTMTDGKVFIYNGTGKQVKLKFEISDTTKIKVPYQLVTIVESTGKTLYYPKTGYDTLIYNQVKEITLDSIPQGKYTLTCKAGKDEYKRIFFIRKRKLEITKEQLKAIFPKTDGTRIEEVVKVINANSSDFGIITPERMAHFVGQIGAETGGLKKLIEGASYTPRAVAKLFLIPNMGTYLKMLC